MNKRGAITLVFDDGYKEVHDLVVPLLEKYGACGVFGIPIQNEHIADWKNISSKHELAGHGVTHNNLTEMSESDMQKELQESRDELRADSIIYPGGAYNNDVVDTAKKYFTAGRTVKFGLETLPPRKPFELKTINYTKKNFSVARANVYALLAYAQNKWLIETFHMVNNKHSDMKHFVYLDDLEAHLDFITSLPIKIDTIRSIIKLYDEELRN